MSANPSTFQYYFMNLMLDQNSVKTAKPTGLYIPYSDIDIFVTRHQPYKIAWNDYLNSNFDFSSKLP